MKSTDLWKKLPTPAELLENPRVRSVVDRLNPTVVTARVRGFLDEVHGELSHRAEEAGLPTLSELADRVSRYLTGASKHQLTGAINATGRLRGGSWVSTPLADAALEQMLLAAQDYTLCVGDAPVGAEAASQLRELTGAEAAVVLHSHASAIELALRTLPEKEGLVIARGEVATIDPGRRLTDLATAAGVTLVEVGAADSVSLEDYQSALQGGRLAIRLAIAGRAADQFCRPGLEELMACAKECGSQVVVEMDGAALRAVEGLGEPTSPTVADAIAWGAELVLVRGNGLVGGPCCGIVVGKSAAIERLLSWPLAASLCLDVQRAAAMSATLRLHANREQAALSIPTLVLATAPVDNLRTRAERLAPQIAGSERVDRAQAVELSEPSPSGVPLGQPSWGVRVWPSSGSAGELDTALRNGSPAVAGLLQKESLLLDLRSVFPRQDIALVAAFEGAGSDGREEESVSAPAE